VSQAGRSNDQDDVQQPGGMAQQNVPPVVAMAARQRWQVQAQPSRCARRGMKAFLPPYAVRAAAE